MPYRKSLVLIATATTAADGTYSLPGVASGGNPLPATGGATTAVPVKSLAGGLTYLIDSP